MLGDASRRVSLVGELEAPDTVHLDRRYRHSALVAVRLKVLDHGDAVDHERAEKVDRIDPPALARPVDAGRMRAERVGHD